MKSWWYKTLANSNEDYIGEKTLAVWHASLIREHYWWKMLVNKHRSTFPDTPT